MFSKDNLKRLAEQAQKAGSRLATNAQGSTNTWFAGQPGGGSPEGISDLPPEEAVAKLQRQNVRLRRKAESALALEQENAQLKTQLEEIATQMATKVAAEIDADKMAKPDSPAPSKEVQLLQAKVEMLRANLTSARSEIEQTAGLTLELETLRAQLKDAGVEPEHPPAVCIPPIAAPRASDTPGEATEQQKSASTASGQASPSQISPFQSVALEAPSFSQVLSTETAGALSAAEEEQSGLDSGQQSALHTDLQTPESSLDHASLVASLQKENAALKAQMQQLSQREAAEEADIVGLQSQNKELIAELEKLRGQIGEARKKLADSRVAQTAADKQRAQLEEQLAASKAEVQTLETQRSEAKQAHDTETSEAQRSHEEELQGLRHTMHMVVEQLRSTQTDYEAKLAKAAAELAAAQDTSEQHMDQLARQLGESDFALRQLKSQADELPLQDSNDSPDEAVSKLQEKTQQLQQSLKNTEQDRQRLVQQVNSVQDALVSEQESHQDAQQQLAEFQAGAEAEKSQLQSQVRDLQTQLASSHASLHTQRDKLAATEAEIAASKTIAEQLEQQVLQLKQEGEAGSAAQRQVLTGIANSNGNKATTQAPGDDLLGVVERLPPDNAPPEVTGNTQLLQQSQATSHDMDRAREIQQQAQRDKQKLQQQLSEAAQHQEQLQQQLDDALSSTDSTREQLQGASEARNDAQQRLKDALARQDSLQEKLQQAAASRDRAEQHAKDASASISDKEQQLKADLDKAKHELNDSTAQRSALSLQLQEAAAREKTLEQELQQANDSNRDLERQLQGLVEETKGQLQEALAGQQEVNKRLAGLQGQEASWQEERQGLRERCERLQKSNQQRRTQLQEAQQAAAHADKVATQLVAVENEAAGLKACAKRAEALAGQCQGLSKELEDAKEGRRLVTVESQKQKNLMERELQAAGRDRDQLAQQVAMLGPVAASNDALHAQLTDLRRDLSQAQVEAALLGPETARANTAEARCRQLEAEAATTASQVSELEKTSQTTAQSLKEVQEACQEAKRAHAEILHIHQEELESLNSKASSAWPLSVRQLVESRERAAVSSAEEAAHAEAEAAEAEFESEAQRLRQIATEALVKQQHAEAQMAAAEARVTAIGTELEERESSLTRQLQTHQSASATQISHLTSETSRLKHELDTALAQARGEVADWQDKWQHLSKELADVKERAWSLLEEKDLQLQSLKAGWPPSAGHSRSARASSSASFAHRTSSTGAAPSSAPESDSGQVTRTISDDSDSEGAILFQPVQFREHVQHPMEPVRVPYARQASDVGTSSSAGQPGVDELAKVKQKVVVLERELADSERTHQLRDTAAEVLKEEVAMLRRSDARGSVDVDYVKNVLLNGFESGELSSDSSLLSVLARLLHFSPAELQRIKTPKPSSMKRTLSRTFLTKLTS